MRATRAKELKNEVMKGYLGDGVTEEDLKKERKGVLAADEFKSMYRARKKNYMRTTQNPKHMERDTGYDSDAAFMHHIRTNGPQNI